ncbi:hypothetical protein LOD99_5139 [Oopsacas minuta]|uniref:FYVE-type domain-containing protein n=1 Tax=Oopsacas minuta TaxID=111878 RepID=A0AAV7JRJ8_9METZ|nr:hypothetical protein LOD99_5139 [Oopsacas minuta]
MAYRDRPLSQLTRQPEYSSLNEDDKLNEQELNDVFNESESYNDNSSTPIGSKSVRSSILSRFDSQDLITHCCNPLCNKKLLLYRRKCYLCGRTFCFECTSHGRELGGTLRQTCAPCFADLHVRQQPGYLRDFKGFFCLRRKSVPMQTSISNGYHKSRPVNKNRNMNIQVSKELDRLCTGFSRSTTSRFKSSINEWVSTAKMPEWQQGIFWQPGHEVTACHTCRKVFSLLSSKQHCRICGRIFCSDCVSPLLMLYKNSVEDTTTHWAINGLEGSPAVEPPVFQLLRMCRSCESQTQQLLLEKRTTVEKVEERDTNDEFIENLLDLYTSLIKHKEYILNSFPPFIQQVEGLSQGTSDRVLASELSRLQADLSDHFSMLAVELQRFRFLQPSTNRQHTMLSNVSKAFLAFYHLHMPTFRVVTRDLYEVFSPDVIQVILEYNNYNTLNIVYIIIKQLCLELLQVVSKFRICEELFGKLSNLNDVIVDELECVVEKRGEDWDSHKSAVSELVKAQFKQKPFVYVGKNRSLYSEEIVTKKVQEKLLLCTRRLEARTDEKSCVNTKRILNNFTRKRVLIRGKTV